MLYQNQAGFNIDSLPGASSLLAAISFCPFDISKFYYAGYLERKSETRIKELKNLLKLNLPIIILDTPYRLSPLIRDLNSVLNPNHQVLLCLELSTPKQQIILTSISKLALKFKAAKQRFVIILDQKNPKT